MIRLSIVGVIKNVVLLLEIEVHVRNNIANRNWNLWEHPERTEDGQ